MQIKIKICGITRYEDARTATNLGADAIGFCFEKSNPRFIEPYRVKEIIKKLPPFISKVGVFCNETPQTIIDTALYTCIDTIQLNGAETPEIASKIGMPVIKTFLIQPGFDLATLNGYKVSAFLLDNWTKMKKVGTPGKTYNWDIVQKAARLKKNIILCGGLGIVNIKEALAEVEPYAVDLCEGVEVGPGIKNPQKMRDIIKMVKEWKYKADQG